MSDFTEASPRAWRLVAHAQSERSRGVLSPVSIKLAGITGRSMGFERGCPPVKPTVLAPKGGRRGPKAMRLAACFAFLGAATGAADLSSFEAARRPRVTE
jgi:hypothetical protein